MAPTPASIQREAEIEVARRPRPAARPPRPLSRPRRPPATEHVDRPWAEAHAQAVKASVCRCCASSDGAYIYYCVPTKHHYVLPLCLHLVLCPQQRCDPQCEEASFCAHFGANCPLCPHYGWLAWQSDDNWRTDGEPMMCWCARAQPLAGDGPPPPPRASGFVDSLTRPPAWLLVRTGNVETATTAATRSSTFLRDPRPTVGRRDRALRPARKHISIVARPFRWSLSDTQ